MPDTDPLYLAATNRVAQRVEGITSGRRFANSDLFEHADQDVCYHLSHCPSFAAATAGIPAVSKKLSHQELAAGSSSRRRRVVSENVVAIFCRQVAGEALFVQRLIARFAIREVGVSPAAGRGVLF